MSKRESVLDAVAAIWFLACLFAVGYGSYRMTGDNYFAVPIFVVAWFLGAAAWADSVDRASKKREEGGAT